MDFNEFQWILVVLNGFSDGSYMDDVDVVMGKYGEICGETGLHWWFIPGILSNVGKTMPI